MTLGAKHPEHQKLWDYLYTNFDVMLLESDIDEIIRLVKEIIEKEKNDEKDT
jgi:hypothetical protein